MLTIDELSAEYYVNQSLLMYESFMSKFIEFPIHFSDPVDLSLKLYHAPFLVFSVDNSESPRYNYLNYRAQQAFEINRESIDNFYMIDSVPEQLQGSLLGFAQHIRKTGKFANYNGLRMSKSGIQFRLNNAFVWSLFTQDDNYEGIAWMDTIF